MSDTSQWVKSAFFKLARLGAIVFLPTTSGKYLMQVADADDESDAGKLRPPGGGQDTKDKNLTQTIIRELGEEFALDRADIKKNLRFLGYEYRDKFWGNAVFELRGHGLRPGVYQASNDPEEKIKLVESTLDSKRYVGPDPDKLLDAEERGPAAKVKSARYITYKELEEYGKQAKGKMLRVYMHDPSNDSTHSLSTMLRDGETPEQGAIRTVKDTQEIDVDETAIERMPNDEDGDKRVRVLLPGKAKEASAESLADRFTPDLTPEQMEEMGDVQARLYHRTKSHLASMESWPSHWTTSDDTKGWVEWYQQYHDGRRTAGDSKQIQRWLSFKARCGSTFVKNPTPRRAWALVNWAIDPLKMLPEGVRESFKKEMDEYKAGVDSGAARAKAAGYDGLVYQMIGDSGNAVVDLDASEAFIEEMARLCPPEPSGTFGIVKLAEAFTSKTIHLPGCENEHEKKAPKNLDRKQLEKGTEEELEHTNVRSMARATAVDHLKEDPFYYTHLDEMKSKLASADDGHGKRTYRCGHTSTCRCPDRFYTPETHPHKHVDDDCFSCKLEQEKKASTESVAIGSTSVDDGLRRPMSQLRKLVSGPQPILSSADINTSFAVGGDNEPNTGPEAILRALHNIDLDTKHGEAMDVVKRKLKSKRPDAVKVLGYIEGLKKMGYQPHELMITKVPVIPPQFRPYSVAGETFVPGDANELYRDLINLVGVHKDLETKLGAGAGFNKLNIYDAVSALYGYGEPTSPKTRERGVSGFLKKVTGTNPKFSFVQRKMLSKDQDYVARGVIGVDPELGLDEIGVPDDVMWTLYAPYVQRGLVRAGMSPEEALRAVRDRSGPAERMLDQHAKERPVIYSRAPSWHKFNVIAGYPKRSKGDMIRINPLVTTGLNADFDGDTLNVHLPSMPEAVADAKDKLMPSKMLFSIKDQTKVMPTPKQEFIMGLFNAQRRPAKRMHNFPDEASALAAIKAGKVNLSDEVKINGV